MNAENMTKKPPTEEQKADNWFQARAEPFLRSIGVRECLQVAEVGFILQGEFRPRLVHDGRLVRGRVFEFRKPRS